MLAFMAQHNAAASARRGGTMKDELLVAAYARSLRSGENGAEALLQVMLETGLAIDIPHERCWAVQPDTGTQKD
jgi:hypothetical protein